MRTTLMFTRRYFLSSCAVTAATPSVAAQATTNSFTITVPAPLYLVSVSASPSADGTVNGGGLFSAGSSNTVTASANSGFSFVNWTQNGSVVSTSASYTFTLNSNTTLVANFTVTSGSPIIAANRMTVWQPGVTYNQIPTAGTAGNTVPSNYTQAGYGIPNRTTIYTTLTPNGTDDTAQLQAAVNNCPAGQVVQLAAGVFRVTGNGVYITTSNITLRGAGAGKGLSTGVNGVCEDGLGASVFPTADPTATIIVKADRATNPNYGVLGVGLNWWGNGVSSRTALAQDAILNSYTATLTSIPSGLAVGQLVLIDEQTGIAPVAAEPFTGLDSDVVYGAEVGEGGASSGAYWWHCPNNCPGPVPSNYASLSGGLTAGSAGQLGGRHIDQIVEIAAINGNTLTFTTPLHHTFHASLGALVSVPASAYPFLYGIGIENIMFFGGTTGGNVLFTQCAYSWVKNCESFFSWGGGFALSFCFRCEIRDSYAHETPLPIYGGGGYLIQVDDGSSDCLVENCISWFGNKVNVARGTGGGNVFAYNYMDDAFGYTYCNSPEAGVNDCHYTCSHMDLIEGNHAQNFKGDSYWGNCIYTMVFRNHLTALRGCRPPLNTYVYTGQTPYVYYGDYFGRGAADNQAYTYGTNFVGNVLGVQGQTLLSDPAGGTPESTFVTEIITSTEWNNQGTYNQVFMWQFGAYQATQGDPAIQNWTYVSDSYSTILRQGNWDWVSQSQQWLGTGGYYGNPASDGVPQTIPNSMYLTAVPPFFAGQTWPWVDPSTGTVYTLPAKLRYDTATYNVIVT
jgi:hypothetical protein